MATYRRKVQHVEAEQFLSDEYCATGKMPEYACNCSLGDSYPHIHNDLTGIESLNHLDWVMHDARGYTVRVEPQEFAARYEQVEDGA